MAHMHACVGVQYAGLNPVAYDIANHWCEYGADYHSAEPHLLDYSLMPDAAQQARRDLASPQKHSVD